MVAMVFNVTELETAIRKALEDYTYANRVFSKSGLRYGVYENVMVVEQNPNKGSIYAKLKTAGFDVKQIMFKEDSGLKGQYLGVVINDDIFIYDTALEYIAGIDKDIFWLYMLSLRPEMQTKDIDGMKVTVGRDSNKRKVIVIVESENLHYMVSIDALKEFLAQRSA